MTLPTALPHLPSGLKQVLLALALVALGYGFGCFAHPSSVKVKTQVQTQVVHDLQVQTQVQYRDRIVYRVVRARDMARDVDTITKTVQRPDGTKTTVTETKTHVQSQSRAGVSETATAQKQEVKDRDSQSLQTEVKTQSKVVTYDRPGWLLSPMVGVGVGGTWGVHYGLDVEHRFLGPIYLGVWGTATGTFTDPVIGLKATLQL